MNPQRRAEATSKELCGPWKELVLFKEVTLETRTEMVAVGTVRWD
jgi:hypothetical protein